MFLTESVCGVQYIFLKVRFAQQTRALGKASRRNALHILVLLHDGNAAILKLDIRKDVSTLGRGRAARMRSMFWSSSMTGAQTGQNQGCGTVRSGGEMQER